VQQVTVTVDDTIVLHGGGDKKAIEERCEQVSFLLKDYIFMCTQFIFKYSKTFSWVIYIYIYILCCSYFLIDFITVILCLVGSCHLVFCAYLNVSNVAAM